MIKDLFSTPARAWSLWVLAMWGHFTFPFRMGFELQRSFHLTSCYHNKGLYFGLWVCGGVAVATGFLWWLLIRWCLQNYPGRVVVWMWRKDHAHKSGWYTVVCALACGWSMKRGVDCLALGMSAMGAFYVGCISLWVSLRAVALAKLPLIAPQDLALRGALALIDRR